MPEFLPEIAERLPLIETFPVPAQNAAEWARPFGPAPVFAVTWEDRAIPGPHGDVPVRIYTPDAVAEGPRPLVLYMHGGAFVHGDLDMPEAHVTSSGIAEGAGSVVISIDYRLCDTPAPWDQAHAKRNPGGETGIHAPVPLDDCAAVLAWARAHAPELGASAERVSLAGASAGGCLAAALHLRAAEEGTPLEHVFLIYPVVHPLNPDPTPEEAEALAGLPEHIRFLPAKMREMNENYAGRPLDEAGPREFPGVIEPGHLAELHAVHGLAPVSIESAEFDDLRTSARRWSEQLRAAGVACDYEVRRGVPHGTLNREGISTTGVTIEAIASRIRAHSDAKAKSEGGTSGEGQPR